MERPFISGPTVWITDPVTHGPRDDQPLGTQKMTPEFEPIYTIQPDSESLTFKSFQTSGNSLMGQHLSKNDMFKRWQENSAKPYQQCSFDFYLSCMIVLSGDFHQRRAIQRKIARNARNIEFKTGRVQDYLKEAMENTTQTKDKKSKAINVKMVNSILDKAFVDVKTELGFPTIDPVEYSYEITDEVIASTTTDECQRYLEQSQAIPIILPKDFERIQDKLKTTHPDDAKDVLSALKKTKSREHLSVVSIDTDNDEIFIHIVNPLRQQIRMESWKFLLLIEEDKTPRQLYDFDKRGYKDPAHQFIFNNCKAGIIEGRFNSKGSSIEVVCRGTNPTDIMDKATFIVDNTYVLCLYTTLRRLKDDKIRFTRLKEEAETTVANKDEFDKLFQ
jgi:hypothetical protein